MDNNKRQISVQYQITFLQQAMNPPGMLIFRVASLAVSGFLIYHSIADHRVDQPELWLTVVSVFMLVISCSGLFYGYGRLRHSPRTLTFTKIGLKHDFAGMEEIIPYENLRVGMGIGGTSILRSASGRFVLVPRTSLSKAELQDAIFSQNSAGA